MPRRDGSGLSVTGQDDWSGGIFRGRRAPENALFDLVGLVDDEGQPFRRGGTVYKSNANVAAAIEGLFDGYLPGGQRTFFWSETAEDVYVLDVDDATPVTVSSSGNVWRRYSRGVNVGGLVWFPTVKRGGSAPPAVGPIGYGGSRKTADSGTFTGTATQGSTSFTGAATTFTTDVDPGMIVLGAGGPIIGGRGVVKRVVNNTTLELVDPWNYAGGAGTSQVVRFRDTPNLPDLNTAYTTYLATAGGRLLICQGSKVLFTPPGDPWGGDRTTDFHQLPESSLIVGAEGVLNTAMIFTTSGVWAISNMEFDALDDVGNVQHTVEQISKDVMLWGDPGIAGWRGALVVPAVDDIFLFTLGSAPRPVSEGVRRLYRDYVKQGYQPGLAAVHRGHYFLPVLNGATVIDVLVCRLDTGAAWSRWSGHAAGGAFATRVGDTTRSPKLLGVAGQRVTDLTGCLDPVAANKLDADGSTPAFSMTTRDFDTGPGIRGGLLRHARLEYELIDAASDNPTLTASVAVGREDAAFTALTGSAPESDGTVPKTHMVNRQGERVRLKYDAVGPSADLRIKRLELYMQQVFRP